jgi:hypothetical protein
MIENEIIEDAMFDLLNDFLQFVIEKLNDEDWLPDKDIEEVINELGNNEDLREELISEYLEPEEEEES